MTNERTFRIRSVDEGSGLAQGMVILFYANGEANQFPISAVQYAEGKQRIAAKRGIPVEAVNLVGMTITLVDGIPDLPEHPPSN